MGVLPRIKIKMEFICFASFVERVAFFQERVFEYQLPFWVESTVEDV